MDFLHSEIGSAKDNLKSPIHNWYKFTAGFSYKFVDEIVNNTKHVNPTLVFDPFAGCGTTLVSCQKRSIPAIGNEAQEFMYGIIKAKLNWDIEENYFSHHLSIINQEVKNRFLTFSVFQIAHPLLVSLYDLDTLKVLYIIRDTINSIEDDKYKLFFRLALSQTLHKVSKHPIAVPYISRNKILNNNRNAWDVFKFIVDKMYDDIKTISKQELTSSIYQHDSRTTNINILDNSCSHCITSPPYLNNLDYGEVSKVHTHFFELTNSWHDITTKVRGKLVTGSTTHYKGIDFSIDDFLLSEFCKLNDNILGDLLNISSVLKEVALSKGGRKSYNILMMLYFKDMFDVLKETRRVLKENGKAYLVVGDSAPYGVYIPTTNILGEIALNVGFKATKISNIRYRGGKWKDLSRRHSLKISENVLILG